MEELRQDLLSRSYKPRIIDDAFKRVLEIERSDAIKRVTKTQETNTMLVTTYHPCMPPISKIAKKHWKVMTDESQVMKNCFHKPPIIAYRRDKNLRDILVRAKLPPKRGSRRTIKGFKGCGELCKLCTFSPNGTTKHHTCKQNGTTYEINSPMNCKTSGVIYKITCKKCPTFVYIRETGNLLNKDSWNTTATPEMKMSQNPVVNILAKKDTLKLICH